MLTLSLSPKFEDKDRLKAIVEEIQVYLVDSFGNPTRIDYGTGHEMAFVMFLVRNTCWLIGLCKAIVYVIQSPPELEEAARWRARRDENPASEHVKEAQGEAETPEIERANAETVH